MTKSHKYQVKTKWIGNTGVGTLTYYDYKRYISINANNKEELTISSDPNFRGDKTKYNPEELFLISISACHQLWYLHLCADNGIIIEEYEDNPEGIMEESESGEGKFISATLNIKTKLSNLDKKEIALNLHKIANKKCFIANSINLEVNHNVEIY